MNSIVLPILMSASLMVGFTVSAQKSCYSDNTNPYLNFASKTAYEHAYNKKGIAAVPDCKAVQLWLVSRHGTRWPDLNTFPEFTELNQIKNHVISNYNANKGSLCMKDIENLKAWQFNASQDVADLLSYQGKQDLYWLGRRIRGYFPELIDTTVYSPEKFVFRHTDTPRTKESAEYFARGVLGLSFEDASPALPEAIADDRLIYPYNNCPTWEEKSKEAKKEQKKFENSEFMNRVIYNVSQRLGFDYNLTIGNVKNIYNGCRYQKAWNVSGISPWCAAFNRDDLEVLEYNEDIKYYYKSGPGTSMNLRLGCPLAKDLFDRFSQVESNPEAQRPNGVFYFSHATMIDILSARLGLTGDSLPLTADNYLEQQRRQFRTSHITPFAGNVLAVLYSCSRGEPLQTIFYQAEDIVRYTGCSVGLCDWNYIKQRMSLFVQDSSCTNDKFCHDSSSATSTSVTLGLLAALVLVSIFSSQRR